ncbi:MAG TPA: SIMPL domain-containing protein [Tepidisphaeraceae bacterium]|jgi:hypothetical protein
MSKWQDARETSGGDGGRSFTLPARVVVSLKAGAVLAIANVACVLIFSGAWMHVRSEAKTITVTGSAKRAIASDLIVWTGRVSALDPDLGKAFDALRAGTDKTLAYLKEQGIAEKDVIVSSIATAKHHARDEKGRETDRVTNYELTQEVQVRSTDVARVAEVARKVTGLIKEGVMLESEAPRYIYTKLADLKIDMLADATKDATTRARQIAGNSGAELGPILDAKMGVMQINPIHGTDVSGTGNNDTTSLEKEITAVVTGRYSLK